MSFLMSCPECGVRAVDEFRYGGEYNPRPEPSAADPEKWNRYRYMRRNVLGVQKEWWYHRLGCGQWFLIERDTAENRVTLSGS